MQVTVSKSHLLKELSLAMGAVERRSTIPILGNVRLEARANGTLELAATDLAIGLRSQCPAQVKEPGITTIPAKRLLDYVRLLPDGDITLKADEQFWTTVTVGRCRTRIAGMSPESFPELPPAPAPTCELPPVALQALIERTSFAISATESRFTINGALLEISPTGYRMVATDGHRMAVADSPATFDGDRFKCLVPHRAMDEILTLVKEAGEDSAISFSSDDNHLFFALGSRVLIARKLAGNFPDYGRVLPQKFESTAVADRAELQAALSRAKVCADGQTNSVCLGFASGQLTITAETFEAGESEEAVPIEYSGCSVQIGFNATYLLEFLRAVGSEKVCVGLNGAFGAAQFAPVLESPDGYKYVVMPMRI